MSSSERMHACIRSYNQAMCTKEANNTSQQAISKKRSDLSFILEQPATHICTMLLQSTSNRIAMLGIARHDRRHMPTHFPQKHPASTTSWFLDFLLRHHSLMHFHDQYRVGHKKNIKQIAVNEK